MPACAHCRDFREVAVTTGRRNPDGTRETTRLTCPVCGGGR
ncbi:hypothetical protein [Carbonactinospora thermoautotrophica]|nr:hypothetical protein [Carbonactinospora thermoautotrophica]